MAEFLGTEDAVTVGMGFATNTLNMPALWSKVGLIYDVWTCPKRVVGGYPKKGNGPIDLRRWE